MWARSLTVRALVALALLFGFYAFALALGLGSFAAAWVIAVKTKLSGAALKLMFVLVVAGGTVLWSLVPRGQKFEPPGPLLEESSQPRLFAVIREVAREMGQPMPREVYAIPDVNAFVARVGGFLGMGGRRVMGIGLGLLAVDNVSQVRATIAHEFGHYAGGDTALGGFIYATRGAMVRTLQNLSSQGSVLVKPFGALFRLFLRITASISRQQELTADEWSVRLAGRTAHVTGLRQEALHGASFGVFFDHEVAPLARAGVLPRNVFEGYRRFAASSGFARMEPELRKMLSERAADPFDSHPPLEDRIAYAESLALPDLPMDETPGLALLERQADLEAVFSRSLGPPDARLVDWDEAAAVLGERLRRWAARTEARVPGCSAGVVLGAVANPSRRDAVAEAVDPSLVRYGLPDRDERVTELTRHMAFAYLATALVDVGWAFRTSPGEPLDLARGDATLDVAKLVDAALASPGEAAALAARVHEAGLSDDRSLRLADDERAAALEPAAEVTVKPDGKKTVVTAPLQAFRLPGVCALCEAPATEVRATRYSLGGFIKSGEKWVELPVPVCGARSCKAEKAFDVRSYDAPTDAVTFVVKSRSYADLVRRVNR